ncbi:hypothetical protein Tther_02105 [Tepidimonas thermarum]|uniref:Uncharacterized protein n=1 Tax=Tepidimonas thermarum TaxID=335431 RepID=A0A554WXY3_9BURK|nr:hypothetical protein [Tepidimonas thermarum]TSE28426.1 hypothetical protein Tther_02105 [Tepidimonas thermarum]
MHQRKPGGGYDSRAAYAADLGPLRVRMARELAILAAVLYAVFGVLDWWAIPSALAPGPGLPPLAAQVARVDPIAFTKVSALGVEEQRVPVVLILVEPLIQTALGDGYRVEARIVVAPQPAAT